MCMIMYHPENAPIPSRATLDKIMTNNPHGFGIHVVGKDIYKTTDAKAFIRFLMNLNESDEFLIHCRLATRGSVCSDNCHPFLDKGTGAVFAHNGVINIPPEDDKTDSQSYFEQVIIPNLSAVYEGRLIPNPFDLNGSRLALYVPEKGYKFFGNWYERNGCLFSKTTSKRDTLWKFDYFDDFVSYRPFDWDLIIE